MSNRETTQNNPLALESGTGLAGRYLIGRDLGSGGCGITYEAVDKVQQKRVAVKECFSSLCCNRDRDGCRVLPVDEEAFRELQQRFQEEIGVLKTCEDLPGGMPIYGIFEENNTKYYAMEFLDGETLQGRLKHLPSGRMSWQETKQVLQPAFQAFIAFHQGGIIHRDISPDNIFLCKDGSTRVIDFGSARVNQKGKSRLVDVAKEGYSPIEVYSGKLRQGTWTDVYSLAATMYRCVTGQEPLKAQLRYKQPLTPPSSYQVTLPAGEERVLMAAMEYLPENRIQTVEELYRGLYGVQPMTEKREGPPMLICFSGVHAGAGIELETGRRLLFGRRPDCQLRFPDGTPGVSGLHCSVIYDGVSGCPVLRDLGSTYGTRLQGETLIQAYTDVYLRPGDFFILGDDQGFVFQK